MCGLLAHGFILAFALSMVRSGYVNSGQRVIEAGYALFLLLRLGNSYILKQSLWLRLGLTKESKVLLSYGNRHNFDLWIIGFCYLSLNRALGVWLQFVTAFLGVMSCYPLPLEGHMQQCVAAF
jgi:hypothetical protein